MSVSMPSTFFIGPCWYAPKWVHFPHVRRWLLFAFIIAQALLPRPGYAREEVHFRGFDPITSFHSIGTQQGDSAWSAVPDQGSGFLTYGSYSTELGEGAFQSRFRLSVDDNSKDDITVGYIDVYDDIDNIEIARREIHRQEFSRANTFQDFALSFVAIGTHKLEFRVFVFGKACVAHASTTVIRTSISAGIRVIPRVYLAGHEVRESIRGTSSGTISQQVRGSKVRLANVLKPPAGNYTAKFNLRIDDNSRDDSNVVTVDAFNKSTNSVLASLDLSRKQFLAGTTQAFELPFVFNGVGQLEFRVFLHATGHIECLSMTIAPIFELSYSGADSALMHRLGSAENGSWSATKSEGPGYLTFGPYTRALPPGVATATFKMLIDDIGHNNDEVALLDAYDASSGKILARRRVMRRDFGAPQSPQDLDLEFEVANASKLEFRVFTYGVANLKHLSTKVTPDRLTLSALWNRKAHWEYRKRDLFISQGIQDYATSSLISQDGIWYAFNRAPATKVSEAQSKICTGRGAPPLQVVVRSSEDHAGTWSEPVVVATPSSSPSAPDYCEVVDGGAFFDTESNVWHYLAQCVNPPTDWSMCHYTRMGHSPLGSFEPDLANPVVVGGQLWSKICGGNGKACPTTMKDEGTPQIFRRNGDGYFYVTFHGANHGSAVSGARGVARTIDFINWQVAGSDLPDNAMLTAQDCNGWNAGWAEGGCIGEGDARILRSDGKYYILTEAADQSLECKSGQKWVFGLLRNAELGATGTWQNYRDNPLVVNQNIAPTGCALVYMNLLRDRGELFLEFSLYSPLYPYPNYIYQLVDGPPETDVMLVK